MTKTFIVVASHADCPPIRQCVCIGQEAADRQAVEYVNDMVKEYFDQPTTEPEIAEIVGFPLPEGSGEWRWKLRALQLARLVEIHGDAEEAGKAVVDWTQNTIVPDVPKLIDYDAQSFSPLTNPEHREAFDAYVAADETYEPDAQTGFPRVWIEEPEAVVGQPETAAPAAASNADLALVLDMAERFANEGAIVDGPDVFVEKQEDGSTLFRPSSHEAQMALRYDVDCPGDWQVVGGEDAEDRIIVPAGEDPEGIKVLLRDNGFSLSCDEPTPDELSAAIERLRGATALPSDVQPITFALRNASGAISSLLHQVGQMSGMFNDEDGTIQDAVDAGEAAEVEIENALERLGQAEGVGAGKHWPRVAVVCHGGVMQAVIGDAPVDVILVDYDVDLGDDVYPMLEQDIGDPKPASVYTETAEVQPDWLDMVEAATRKVDASAE